MDTNLSSISPRPAVPPSPIRASTTDQINRTGAASPREAMRELSIGPTTLNKMRLAGEIASFKIGRLRRYPYSEIDRIIAAAARDTSSPQ